MVKEENDDFESRKKKRGGGSFWTSDRILLIVFLIIGLIVGGYITHQFIEPIVSADYPKCKADLKLLSEQINSCLQEKSALEKQLGINSNSTQ